MFAWRRVGQYVVHGGVGSAERVREKRSERLPNGKVEASGLEVGKCETNRSMQQPRTLNGIFMDGAMKRNVGASRWLREGSQFRKYMKHGIAMAKKRSKNEPITRKEWHGIEQSEAELTTDTLPIAVPPKIRRLASTKPRQRDPHFLRRFYLVSCARTRNIKA